MNYNRRYKGILKAQRVLRIFKQRAGPASATIYLPSGRLAKTLLRTRQHYPCIACGNPRRHYGEKTIKEKCRPYE